MDVMQCLSHVIQCMSIQAFQLISDDTKDAGQFVPCIVVIAERRVLGFDIEFYFHDFSRSGSVRRCNAERIVDL
jgi:hypothetical protein